MSTPIVGSPLPFLPPTIIHQSQAVSYIFTAYLTAFVYDGLLSMSEEHDIALKSGLSPSNTIYFLSRIASLIELVAAESYETAPVKDCQGLDYVFGGFYAVSILSTSFLFLLRVRAVYQNSRSITALFGFVWLLILVFFGLDTSSLSSRHIPHTELCYSTKNIQYFTLPSIILICIYDTSVFLAISYRLTSNAATDGSFRARIRCFIKGDGLYSLSRSLLQSGQVYYLVTVTFSFVYLTMILSSYIPITLRYTLAPSYAAFTNIAACRVFRGVIIEDSALTTTDIVAAFRSAPPIPADIDGSIYELT